LIAFPGIGLLGLGSGLLGGLSESLVALLGGLGESLGALRSTVLEGFLGSGIGLIEFLVALLIGLG